MLAAANTAAGSGQFPGDAEVDKLAGLNMMYGEIVGIQSKIDALLAIRAYCVTRYERELDRLNETFQRRDYRPLKSDDPILEDASTTALVSTTNVSVDTAKTDTPNMKEAPVNASASSSKAIESGPSKIKKGAKEMDGDKEKARKPAAKAKKEKETLSRASTNTRSKGKGKGRAHKSKELIDDELDDIDMAPAKLSWAEEMDRNDEEEAMELDGEAPAIIDEDDAVDYSEDE